MSEIAQLVELGQAGAVVLLVVAVAALWRRLNAVTDRFNTYLEDRARDGVPAAQRAVQRNGGPS